MKRTFRQYLEDRELKPRTIQQYEGIIAHFHRHLNNAPISKQSVYEYLSHCHQTQSFGTNNNYRNVLRQYFKFLADTNQSNIHNLVRLKNKRYSFLPKVTTKNAVLSFTSCVLNDSELLAMEKLIVLLIKNHGIQNKFFPHIRVSDYDCHNNRLKCHHLEIELSEQEKYYMKLCISKQKISNENDYLFKNRLGKVITSQWVSSLFSRLQKKYRITMTSNMLRNYFVITCVERKMPLIFISRYIGRKSLTNDSSIYKLQSFSERIIIEKQKVINELRSKIGGEQHNVFKSVSTYIQVIPPINTQRTTQTIRTDFDYLHSKSDNSCLNCEYKCSTTHKSD